MAFLLLMETVSPTERAVFLLHEVFDYDYGEISNVLGKTEVNCRQILTRARQRISASRPRFESSPQQEQRLMDQFRRVSLDGDLQGLIALLADDITLYSDGGGKVAAALRPIHGADRVARFIQGAVRTRVCGINGQPGIVSYIDGRPQSVLVMDH